MTIRFVSVPTANNLRNETFFLTSYLSKLLYLTFRPMRSFITKSFRELCNSKQATGQEKAAKRGKDKA